MGLGIACSPKKKTNIIQILFVKNKKKKTKKNENKKTKTKKNIIVAGEILRLARDVDLYQPLG